MAFSAVLSGIREIKDVMAAAEHSRRAGRRTIVFVDEVHRFNKSQQDAFLPHVEAGNIILIGATTENPSFEVIAPLLSRTRVYTLQSLTSDEILGLLQRAVADKERGLGNEKLDIAEGVLERISIFADGDARAAYNTLEALARAAAPGPNGRRRITEDLLSTALQRKFLHYDKSGEEHYNLISALHKSVRNSDADAALYWLARMLESGEAPLYIARRLVRMASEDIGLADPQALSIAVAAMQAADFVGRARRQPGAGAGRRVSGAGAEIKCAVHGLRRGAEGFAGHRRRACAAASAQRRHQIDAPRRLRQGLSVRARRAVESGGHDVPAGESARAALLPADGPGIRRDDCVHEWKRLREYERSRRGPRNVTPVANRSAERFFVRLGGLRMTARWLAAMGQRVTDSRA